MTREEKIAVGAVLSLGAALLWFSRERSPQWRLAEEETCRRRGLGHLGGPGRDDCEGGVENNHWTSRPVDAGIIERAYENGVVEVVSSGGTGFTGPAIDRATHYGIRLSERG